MAAITLEQESCSSFKLEPEPEPYFGIDDDVYGVDGLNGVGDVGDVDGLNGFGDSKQETWDQAMLALFTDRFNADSVHQMLSGLQETEIINAEQHCEMDSWVDLVDSGVVDIEQLVEYFNGVYHGNY